MSFLTIVLIALGLSMDAFAVAVANGVSLKQCRAKHALLIASFFGAFQAIMPIIGWLAGLSLKNFISNIDHWIAFGLLAFIGGKMILESLELKEAGGRNQDLCLKRLFLLSIATSIDAVAVGLSFAFINVSIAAPALIIGIVTFVVSFMGVFIGKKVGHFFENKIGIIGGVILIGIGLKILIEHLIT